MRLATLLLVTLLACSPSSRTPALSNSTYTYDDGKGTKVLLRGKQVEVTSTHFEPLSYTLASDNVALKLSEFDKTISQGTASTPPSLGNGQGSVPVDSLPDAKMIVDQLVPKKDGIGPDSAWVGGLLGRSDLEGGFWTLSAAGTTFVLPDGPPETFKAGETVIVTGQVDTDTVSAANAGPQYRVSLWRVWKP